MNMKRLQLLLATGALMCSGICFASVGQTVKMNALGGLEIRAALSYSDVWGEADAPENEDDGLDVPCGIYSIPVENGVTPEFYFLTGGRNMEGGAVYVDGVIHAVSRLTQWYWDDEYEYWDFENTGAAFTTFDAETGDVLFDSTDVGTDLCSQDLCYDKKTGNIYGVFSKDYKNAWGILDVDKLEVSYINLDMGTAFAAIDVDSKGDVYGITSDGKLVTIDKNTGSVSVPLAQYNFRKGYKSTGVIDPRTKTFYLLLQSWDDGGMYAINLTSYEIEQITTFDYSEQWGGAYIAGAEIDEGTPAGALNLSVSFPNASLDGTVSFEAPVVTAEDDDIRGTTLNYTVAVDDNVVANGTVIAGEAATSDKFTVTPGNHIVSVVLSNENGEGVPASMSYWFGNDAPAAVGNIILSKQDNSVSISWEAPARSMHDGYYNPEEVTYTVTRMPEQTVVAQNIKETDCVDNIGDKPVAKYYYTIVPKYIDQEGISADSEGIIVGESLSVPYETTFTKEESVLMSVEDANSDNNTWQIGRESGSALYTFGDVQGDDWLYLAPLHFEAGKAYCLSASLSGKMGRKEAFEVKMGTDPSSAAMTTSIVGVTEFEQKEDYLFDEYFSVPQAGTYYIGFHALSPETHFALWINSVKVDEKMSDSAPAAGQITAIAGEKGALTATLTITAPTKNFNGEELTSLKCANIFHEGELIETLNEVARGETYTYVHEASHQGNNVYSVVFENEYGGGMIAETSLFVGQDIPLAPTNVHFTFEGNDAVLTWDAPGMTGVNGGYVDPQSLVYSVTYTKDRDWVIMDDTAETKAVVGNYDMTGDQEWLVFGVMAATDAGVSEAVYSNGMIVGDPYIMPYLESLDNGRNKTMFASTNLFEHVGNLNSDVEKGATDNPGCLTFTPYAMLFDAPYNETITTGIINTTGYRDVTMSFYYFNDAGSNDGDELTVTLYDQNNDVVYPMGKVKMDANSTEWRLFEAQKAIAADNIRMHININSVNGHVIYLDEFALSGTSGAGAIINENISVNAGNGEIHISGLGGENVIISTLTGVVVYSADGHGDIDVPVSDGVYVVNIAGKSFKVIVK